MKELSALLSCPGKDSTRRKLLAQLASSCRHTSCELTAAQHSSTHMNAPGAKMLRQLPMFDMLPMPSVSVEAPTVMLLGLEAGENEQASPPLLLPASSSTCASHTALVCQQLLSGVLTRGILGYS